MHPMRTLHAAIIWRLILCLIWSLGPILGLSQAAMAGLSHDEALEAVRSGKILPILTIIEKVEREYNGRVVEVELENDEDGNAGMTYEINLITAEGRFLEFTVNAQTGEVIGLGGRGIGGERN